MLEYTIQSHQDSSGDRVLTTIEIDPTAKLTPAEVAEFALALLSYLQMNRMGFMVTDLQPLQPEPEIQRDERAERAEIFRTTVLGA